MAKLKHLIIHCTATPEGREVTKEDIEQWHLKGRGWSRVGYSDLIQLDGSLINLIDWNQDDLISSHEISNGAKGFNSNSRHIVYAGGMDANNIGPKNTLTPNQHKTLSTYIKFHILRYPDIKILGHNQISNKACPSFEVGRWLENEFIDCKNIY